MQFRFSIQGLPIRAIALLLVALLTACAGNTWRRDIGPHWQERVETGTRFQHRVLFKPGQGDTLHIYFDGDGRIWRNADELYADPTPPRALALQLMQADPAPALLIGRPCYLQVNDAQCAPYWWTGARYSQTVLDSLQVIAQRWSRDYHHIVLIGYSGGGALAVLLAPHIEKTQTVITLAGNLDIAAWLRAHNYSAQVAGASLDPATQPPLPAHIAQWHFAGAADTNIEWQWIEAFSARQRGAHFEKLAGFDHHCCWVQQWPALLQATELRSTTTGDQNSIR